MARINVQLGEPSFHFINKTIKENIRRRPHNVFDFTMIDTFMTCPSKYYYRHEENLSSIESAPAALLMGAGIHASLATYYNCIKNLGKTVNLEEITDLMKRAFVSEIAEDIRTGNFPTSVDEAHDGKRCVHKAFDIIEGYIEHYGYDLFEEITEVEQPFAMILPYYDTISKEAGDIIYVGRRDTMVKMGGRSYVLEHKTASRISATYLESYTINHQVSGYIKSAMELTGEDVRRAIINVLGVYKNGTRFERVVVHRTRKHLDLFTSQIINLTSLILDNRRRIVEGEDNDVVFWQQPGNCFKWNNRCQFFALCATVAKGTRESIKQYRFRKDTWIPYDIVDLDATDIKDKDTTDKNEVN